MHADPVPTESLTGERHEPVNGGGGYGTVTLLRAPGGMHGALAPPPGASAMAEVPARVPADWEAPDPAAFLAGYYLG